MTKYDHIFAKVRPITRCAMHAIIDTMNVLVCVYVCKLCGFYAVHVCVCVLMMMRDRLDQTHVCWNENGGGVCAHIS